MALVSEHDQKILNEYQEMIARTQRENAASAPNAAPPGAPPTAYRAMMLKINPYKKPPGLKEAEMAAFHPAMELRPGLTASIAIPKGKGPFPVMVHAHGHGLQAGRPPEFSPWMRVMASYGFTVVFPDYRWQPENTYADQIDDMLFSIKWVKDNAAKINADASKLILGGDSLGGALALDVLMRTLEDPNGPRFRAFESVDGILTGNQNSGRDMISKIKPETPMPPVIMIVGSADFACAPALACATALTTARKPYDLQVFYGLPHDFAKFPQLDAMKAANARLMEFLKRATA